MRLISSVARLEAAAAAAREARAAAVGLVWSMHEERVDPDLLERGEYIACDVKLEGSAATFDRTAPPPDAASNPPAWWAVTERVTLDEADLGLVYDGEGVRVGRVVELDGTLIKIEWDPVRPAA